MAKLFKIKNVSVFHFNANNNALIPYFIGNYFTLVCQPHTTSPCGLSSYSLLNFAWKRRLWMNSPSQCPHVGKTPRIKLFCMHTSNKGLAWDDFRIKLVIFAKQNISNIVKRKKRHNETNYPSPEIHPPPWSFQAY